MNPPRFQAPSRICLGCRTLLAEGQTCGAKRNHTAVSLGVAAERSRLDDEVWGPDSRARQLRRAAKAGAGGGFFGSLLDGCSGCDVGLEGCGDLAGGGAEVIGAIIGFIVFAVIAAAVVWLVSKLVQWIREKMDRPKPHGALQKPPRPGGRWFGAGTITGESRIATPWKEGECAAYALELLARDPFAGGALLRDASSAGFDITLDDGRRVRIPKGPIRIVSTKLEEDDVDKKRVDEYLRDVDPGADSAADRSLFPYDHARAVTLSSGARVDLYGELEMTSNPDAQGYRASAGMLVPVGIPILRVRRAVEDAMRVRVADDGGGTASAAPAEAEAEAATSSSDRSHDRGRERAP